MVKVILPWWSKWYHKWCYFGIHMIQWYHFLATKSKMTPHKWQGKINKDSKSTVVTPEKFVKYECPSPFTLEKFQLFWCWGVAMIKFERMKRHRDGRTEKANGSFLCPFAFEFECLLNVTCNNFSAMYVTAHRCAGGLKKKLDLWSGSQCHRHFS